MSKKRNRRRNGAPGKDAARRKVREPKARLPVAFAVLSDVATAADETLAGAAISDTPLNRVQIGAFVRGINALKSVRSVAEQSQWEFAAGPVRQRDKANLDPSRPLLRVEHCAVARRRAMVRSGWAPA